jgi:hypothetical protein
VVQDGTTATANLQLLDEVLGQIASRVDNDQVDEPFATALADGQQDSQATDLALAAVFEDEAPWWLSV